MLEFSTRRRTERANLRGFRDALAIGRPSPFNMPPSERMAYNRGFTEGERAVARIVKEARDA